MNRSRWRLGSQIITVLIITLAVLAVIPSLISAAYHNVGSFWFLHGRLNSSDPLTLGKAEKSERMSLDWKRNGQATRANVNLIRILVDLAQIDKAAALSQSVRLPIDPILNVELGEAVWKTGNTATALKHWRKAPNSDVYFAKRGLASETAGDLAAALADYRISWAIDNSSVSHKGEAYLHFAELLRKEGNVSLAITVCQRLRKSGTNVFWANRLLGMMHFDMRDFVNAEKFFREAQELRPHVYRVDLWLGLAVARQGRLRDAIQIYERGLVLHPQDGLLHFELGRALLASGEIEDAQHHIETSIKLAPDTDAWDSQYVDQARRLLNELP